MLDITPKQEITNDITDTERLDFIIDNQYLTIKIVQYFLTEPEKPNREFFEVRENPDDGNNGLNEIKISEGNSAREAIDAAIRSKDGH